MRLRKKTFVTLGVLLWVVAAVSTLLPSWPHLYYRLFPQTSDTLASTIASTVNQVNTPPQMATPISTPEIKEIPLPDIDPSLPKDNGLLIDKIGVKGLIHEGTDWENILKLGVSLFLYFLYTIVVFVLLFFLYFYHPALFV